MAELPVIDLTNSTACNDFIASASPSSICSLLPQELILTGLFRDLLIKHFSTANQVEEPSLKHLIWQGSERTDILIESVHAWTPQMAHRRPAVLIKRDDCNYLPMGIGDRRQGPPADSRGDPHYVRYWMGSHTLFCIGGTGAQAELLATEVKRYLSHFGPLIRETIDLKQFRVVRIGAVGQLEEAAENFVVPVSVGYTFEDRVIIRENSPALHAISLSLLLDT